MNLTNIVSLTKLRLTSLEHDRAVHVFVIVLVPYSRTLSEDVFLFTREIDTVLFICVERAHTQSGRLMFCDIPV